MSWHLGFVEGGLNGIFLNSSLKVNWVYSPYKDRWFADPFILDVTDSKIYVLVEEFVHKTQIGRIAKLTIDKNRMAIEKMDIILELPTHLSFPNILRKDGHIYIYPENCRSGKQDIYEYDEKTNSLRFIQTICNDIIWDATMTDYFGRIQLFTAKSNDYYLDIYEWNEEASRFLYLKSIESDKKNSRMAGQLFKYNGEIYCPCQNCERTYGGAVDIKKAVYRESDSNLSFEFVKQVKPEGKYNKGLHTLNSYKGWTIIDAKEYDYYIGRFLGFLIEIKKKIVRNYANR
ncbi:MAG: hypothetical protein KBT00_02520 [Bacteroidales bacterium]|nr:hypothetical protein [Candidatus Cacconaster merdequi]